MCNLDSGIGKDLGVLLEASFEVSCFFHSHLCALQPRMIYSFEL